MEILFIILTFAAIYFALQAGYWYNRAKELEKEHNENLNTWQSTTHTSTANGF